MKRTFIAINIEPEKAFLELISELKDALKSQQLKWVEELNFHLTLQFIGETTHFQQKEVTNLLLLATESKSSFELKINGIGYFGARNQPHVLLANVEKNEQLELLVQKIAEGLAALGLPCSLKSFAPHITLARIKTLENQRLFHSTLENYKNQVLQSSAVTEIIYYESILHPAGPVYKPIQIFKLK